MDQRNNNLINRWASNAAEFADPYKPNPAVTESAINQWKALAQAVKSGASGVWDMLTPRYPLPESRAQRITDKISSLQYWTPWEAFMEDQPNKIQPQKKVELPDTTGQEDPYTAIIRRYNRVAQRPNLDENTLMALASNLGQSNSDNPPGLSQNYRSNRSDISPLLELIDTYTGSNFAKSYESPRTEERYNRNFEQRDDSLRQRQYEFSKQFDAAQRESESRNKLSIAKLLTDIDAANQANKMRSIEFEARLKGGGKSSKDWAAEGLRLFNYTKDDITKLLGDEDPNGYSELAMATSIWNQAAMESGGDLNMAKQLYIAKLNEAIRKKTIGE